MRAAAPAKWRRDAVISGASRARDIWRRAIRQRGHLRANVAVGFTEDRVVAFAAVHGTIEWGPAQAGGPRHRVAMQSVVLSINDTERQAIESVVRSAAEAGGQTVAFRADQPGFDQAWATAARIAECTRSFRPWKSLVAGLPSAVAGIDTCAALLLFTTGEPAGAAGGGNAMILLPVGGRSIRLHAGQVTAFGAVSEDWSLVHDMLENRRIWQGPADDRRVLRPDGSERLPPLKLAGAGAMEVFFTQG